MYASEVIGQFTIMLYSGLIVYILVQVLCVFAMEIQTTSSSEDARVIPDISMESRKLHGWMLDHTADLKHQNHKNSPVCRCKKNCFQEIGYNKLQMQLIELLKWTEMKLLTIFLVTAYQARPM